MTPQVAESISTTFIITVGASITAGITLCIFGFLLNMVFSRLKDVEDTKLHRSDFNKATSAIRGEIRTLDENTARKESCTLSHKAYDEKLIAMNKAYDDKLMAMNKSFDDKITNVHNKVDAIKTDTKDTLDRLEKFMAGMSESLDDISTCVTKLSASVKCD